MPLPTPTTRTGRDGADEKNSSTACAPPWSGTHPWEIGAFGAARPPATRIWGSWSTSSR